MTTQTRQRWVILGTLIVLLLMAIPTFAAKAPKHDKANDGHGKVTAIGSNSITVTPKTGTAKTFTTSDTTVVTLDGKAAKLTDVIMGDNAKVKSDDGKAATEIAAKTHVKKAKKIAAPAV